MAPLASFIRESFQRYLRKRLTKMDLGLIEMTETAVGPGGDLLEIKPDLKQLALLLGGLP